MALRWVLLFALNLISVLSLGCIPSESPAPTSESITKYLAINGLGVIKGGESHWKLERIPIQECHLAFPKKHLSNDDLFVLIVPDKYDIVPGLPNDSKPPEPIYVSINVRRTDSGQLVIPTEHGISLGYTSTPNPFDAISRNEYGILYSWNKEKNTFVIVEYQPLKPQEFTINANDVVSIQLDRMEKEDHPADPYTKVWVTKYYVISDRLLINEIVNAVNAYTDIAYRTWADSPDLVITLNLATGSRITIWDGPDGQFRVGLGDSDLSIRSTQLEQVFKRLIQADLSSFKATMPNV